MSEIFPLDPDMVMFLKFFILFTCIFFWIKLGYDAAFRDYRGRRGHRHDR